MKMCLIVYVSGVGVWEGRCSDCPQQVKHSLLMKSEQRDKKCVSVMFATTVLWTAFKK